MKRTLIIGTGNTHKVSEIAPLLAGLDFDLKAAGEYGPFAPVEDGDTLEANAEIKARAAIELSGEWAIADDTGLFIDALDGRPGIYAARYAGEHCSFADNIKKVLGEMRGVPDEKRTATFSCVIAFARPSEAIKLFRGDCKGEITTGPRGNGGFGYDPIFVISSVKKSFAELSAGEKNGISHRSIAVKQCRDFLSKLLTRNPKP